MSFTDVMMEKVLKIIGTLREKSCPMHGHFSQNSLFESKATQWIFIVGVETDVKRTTSRPDKLFPKKWKHRFDASKHKEKQDCRETTA